MGIKTISESTIARIIKDLKEEGIIFNIDSITPFKDGIRRYIITAKDYKIKMEFAYGYKTLSSASAKDFMEKLEKVIPFPIKRIQTDKAFEFEG